MLKPAWSLLRLVLLALVSVLAVGCLLQTGKTVAAVNAATDSAVNVARSTAGGAAGPGVVVRACRFDSVRDASARPDGSGGAAEQGTCGKQALAESSSIAPAAASTQVAAALSAPASPSKAAGLPGSVGQRSRCAPEPPPDVGRLCVLRI